MTADRLREEIGHRFGMTTSLAQLLQGETAAEIEADVRAFLAACGAVREGTSWVYDDPVKVSAEMRRRREARAEMMRRESEREGDALLADAMQKAGWDE